MDEFYKTLKDRRDTAKESRSCFEGTLGEIGKYVWPNMQNITCEVKTDAGDMVRTVSIYDSTGSKSADRMTKGILGNMMPVGMKWFEFAAQDDEENDNLDVKQRLAERTAKVHKVLWQSNFISKMYTTIRSMVTYTIGCIGYEKVDKGYSFNFYPIGDFLFETNSKGEPDTVFRRMNLNARQARQEFGKTDLGKQVELALKESKSDKFEFVHCVFPNADYDGKYGSKKYASKIMNITDEVFIESDKFKNGYNSLPYKVAKYEESDNDAIGSSPSVDSLPDIKMANDMAKTFIVTAEKEGDPLVVFEDDGVVGQPVTSPGGSIVMRHGAEKPYYLKTGASSQAVLNALNEKRQEIRANYLNDVFDALSYYRRETAAELKVVEIQEKINEGFLALAPLVASMQKFLLDPIIMDINADFKEEDDLDMKIVYQGRLALAMSSMQTNAIETVLMQWMGYDEKYGVFDNIDIDGAFKVSAINRGVPANLIKKQEDVAMERQQKNAPAQAMADAEIAEQASKAYKNFNG